MLQLGKEVYKKNCIHLTKHTMTWYCSSFWSFCIFESPKLLWNFLSIGVHKWNARTPTDEFWKWKRTSILQNCNFLQLSGLSPAKQAWTCLFFITFVILKFWIIAGKYQNYTNGNGSLNSDGKENITSSAFSKKMMTRDTRYAIGN